MRHRDIALNPTWHVAGYTRLKLAFVEIIIKSDLHVVTKGQLVKTLDKYIAVGMSLALAAYDVVILDWPGSRFSPFCRLAPKSLYERGTELPIHDDPPDA